MWMDFMRQNPGRSQILNPEKLLCSAALLQRLWWGVNGSFIPKKPFHHHHHHEKDIWGIKLFSVCLSVIEWQWQSAQNDCQWQSLWLIESFNCHWLRKFFYPIHRNSRVFEEQNVRSNTFSWTKQSFKILWKGANDWFVAAWLFNHEIDTISIPR